MAGTRDAAVQGVIGGVLGAGITILAALALRFGFSKADIATVTAAMIGAAIPVAAALWVEAEKTRSRRVEQLGLIPQAIGLLSVGCIGELPEDKEQLSSRIDAALRGYTMMARALQNGAMITDDGLFQALYDIQQKGAAPASAGHAPLASPELFGVGDFAQVAGNLRAQLEEPVARAAARLRVIDR